MAAFLWGCTSITLVPPQYLARLFLPVIIMVFYRQAGYRSAKAAGEPALYSARVAQLADSLYFLGFLWTLWALIDSFLLRGLSGAQGAFNAFGYALVTTAAGMFLRMHLLQFKYRGSEQAEEAQLSVEEALQRFATTMKTALDSLQKFEAASSTTSNRLQEFQDSVDAAKRTSVEVEKDFRGLGQRILEQSNREVQAAVQTFVALLKPSLEEFKASVRDGAAAVTEGTFHLRQTIAGSVQEAREVTSEAARTMRGVLEGGLAEVRTSLALLSSDLEAGANVIESELRRLAARIDEIRVPADILAKTDGLSESVRATQAALAQLSTVLQGDGIRAALTRLSSHIHASGEGLQGELNELAEHVHQLRLPEGLMAKVDDFNSAAGSLHSAVALLGTVLHTSSDELGTGAKSVETALSQFANEINRIRLPKDIVMGTEEFGRRIRELEETISQVAHVIRQHSRRLSYSTIQVIHGGDF
jgi:hypothetical protein